MVKGKRTSLQFLVIVLLIAVVSCKSETKEYADTILENTSIYTLNEQNLVAEALAIRNGEIMAIGTSAEINKLSGEETEHIDLAGAVVYPGFIESHGHFVGLGRLKMEIDLLETESLDDVLSLVDSALAHRQAGEWVTGRGWHQSKWETIPEKMVKGFQVHDRLSAIAPDNPVYLRHASGHAAYVNAKAMELAGINEETVVEGKGEVIKDENGDPTGILVENAAELVSDIIPEPDENIIRQSIAKAQEESLANGITGFCDAWVSKKYLDVYQDLENDLKIRLYCMLDGMDTSLLDNWFVNGPYVGNKLVVRSIKLSADGALGSRGAWLLEPYCDRPDHYGHATIPMDYVGEVGRKAINNGFQLGTHAIGDRTNKEVLDQYELVFNEKPGVDHRFRIEHAQHLTLSDIPRFAALNVIASMQGIHMSSDRPWAIDRLCEERILEGAYVWRKLIESGAMIMNGTDCPVEPINPLACFYASVTRKTLKGTPEQGYEPDQKMTRVEALKTYTYNAAYGCFWEEKKGTIEVGKWADLTILDNDLLTCQEDEILSTKVLMTIVDGEVVYSLGS